MLWVLRLLGAPSDPDENMAWQYRHPARVAFAGGTILGGFFSAFFLASTQQARAALVCFVACFLFIFVFAYVAARVRIARSGPPAAGGTD